MRLDSVQHDAALPTHLVFYQIIWRIIEAEANSSSLGAHDGILFYAPPHPYRASFSLSVPDNPMD